MKRIAVFLICLLLLLTGCGTKPAPVTQPDTQEEVTAETEPSAPETTAPAPLSREEQADLIFRNRELWRQEEFSDYEQFYYTFTDLDHNGRMEVFAATTQGTGVFTSGAVYEVEGDSLVKYSLPEGEDLPEVIVRLVQCYRDPASGRYFYTFRNTTRLGAAESWTVLNWLSLDGGELNVESLAWSHFQYDFDTGEEIWDYADAEGPISGDEFERAAAKAGAGMTAGAVRFDWRTMSEITSPEDILNAYRVFLGEQKLLRPQERVDTIFLEGMEEAVVYELFAGDGYSIYVPKEQWNYAEGEVAGYHADVWQSPWLEEIRMEIVKLPGMDRAAAREWANQLTPDGMDASGKILSCAVHEGEDASYVIRMHYTLEAAEGAGMRFAAMAETFEPD